MFESMKDGTIALLVLLLSVLLVLDLGESDEKLESVLITKASLPICQSAPRAADDAAPVEHPDTKEIA
jgi:hypothetical protein